VNLLLTVITEITLPIVFMIGAGYVLQRRFALDGDTLNRLTIYGTLPCLLVVSLANAPLPSGEVGVVVLFTVAQFFVLLGLGWIAALVFRVPAELRPVLALAVPFANVANYGFPLIELAFGPAWLPHQAIVAAVLTVLIFILAPLMLYTGGSKPRPSAAAVMRTPVLVAVAIGLVLNVFDIPLPRVIDLPLRVMGGANTPVALMALGAMLSIEKWQSAQGVVGLGVGLRLLFAPAVTWVALTIFALPEGMSEFFLIGVAAPVGILLPILCAEYGRRASVASAMVVGSTALSPVMVTVMVYLARAF